MTNTPYYETMYILRPDIPEEEVEKHLTKYSDLLTNAGGTVLDNQMRGKRRLAYPISKHKEGIYVQLSHSGDGQHVSVLEKAMRLSEDVIRYLTVKQDGPLPTPRASTNNEKSSSKDSKQEIENKEKDADVKEKDAEVKEKDAEVKEKDAEVKEKDTNANAKEVETKEEKESK